VGVPPAARRRPLQVRAFFADLADVDSSRVTPPPALRPETASQVSCGAALPNVCLDAARAALAALRRPITFPDAAPSPCSAADLARPRFGHWFNRSRRVLLALAAVWVIAVFDLGYTLAESGTADFTELNPVAARLLGGPASAVIAYKFALLGVGTLILLGLRRHAIAELACWFLFVAELYVALRWYGYFDCLLEAGTNSAFDAAG
jgi:hypothetical protein